MSYSPDEDLPWSPAEQDAYRHGRKLWRRTWKGSDPEQLWRLYGGHDCGLIECPDCGRPHGHGMDDYNGLCWNCHTENTRPGWQAECIAKIFPSMDGPKGKETNPLVDGVKIQRLK